jgi:hypothetical protein
MSALAIVLSCVFSAACGFMAGYVFGDNDGYSMGKSVGRDLQRVDDICERWSEMPDRDSRGRFKRKCGLICQRNQCVDTSATPPML